MAIDIQGIAISLSAGTELLSLDKGVITYKHLARWSGPRRSPEADFYSNRYARD